MAFTESLTVRILGDSSGLQQELSRVLQSIEGLHQRIEATSRAGGQIGSALSRASQATGPLQQISNLLTRISQQSRALAQQPVTLNVTPAMRALQQLVQSASTAAAQLRTLSAFSAISAMPMPRLGPSTGTPPGAPFTRRMAAGGLIAGPSGIDKIPTRLTAGEYVLSQHAVRTLGHSFVDRLNQHPEAVLGGQPAVTSGHSRDHAPAVLNGGRQRTEWNRSPPLTSLGMPPSRPSQLRAHSEPTSPSVSNHFGGISVVVQQASDVGDLLQRIEQQQRALRNRRG